MVANKLVAGVLLVCLALFGVHGEVVAQRLAPDTQARIGEVFAEYDRSSGPGCAVGVVQAGRLVYSRGFGMGQLEHGIPLTPSSVFYLASVAKQFTAAAIIIAEHEGYLALDDDVRRHIPELRDYGREITVRDLLHHTSGVRDYFTLLAIAGNSVEDVFTVSEALALIARQDLNFEPGSEYLYSNSGYVLLAEIIRRSTGRSLREYAAEKIFQPLGMTDTHFHDDRRHVVPGRVFSYDLGPDGSWRTNYLMNLEMVGDGGLYSTVEDLARWDAAFYDDLLGVPDFAARMYTRGVLSTGDTIYYAGGLGVGVRRGLTRVTHAGGLMAFRTMTARYPDQRTSVITLCNVGTANAALLGSSVEDLLLEGEFLEAAESPAPSSQAPETENPARPVPASIAAELVGTYHSEELQMTLVLESEGGELRVGTPSGNAFPITIRGEVFVTSQGLVLEFVRMRGNVVAFLLSAPRARNIRFERSQD